MSCTTKRPTLSRSLILRLSHKLSLNPLSGHSWYSQKKNTQPLKSASSLNKVLLLRQLISTQFPISPKLRKPRLSSEQIMSSTSKHLMGIQSWLLWWQVTKKFKFSATVLLLPKRLLSFQNHQASLNSASTAWPDSKLRQQMTLRLLAHRQWSK